VATERSRIPDDRGATRRTFLIDGASVLAAGTVTGQLARSGRWFARNGDLTEPRPSQIDALRALGRSRMRIPDSLPYPAIAAGADTIPEIEHIVVVMLENHSYDNLFGILGRVAAVGLAATVSCSAPTATLPRPIRARTAACRGRSGFRPRASCTASRARSGPSPTSSMRTAATTGS
jgi:hypothetical protein